jgi:hypothetical protein
VLSSLQNFKSFLNIFGATDMSEDAYDAECVQTADAIFKGFCKRSLETQVHTIAHDGKDEVDLAIKQRPVQAPVFSCTLTQGSAVVNNMSLLPQFRYPTATNGAQLSGTQNLMVGMPAAIVASSSANATLAPIPAMTTITSLNSATSVTLSNNATQSGTFNVVFGIDVYLNPFSGRYGDSYQAFTQQNQLMLGLDYVLKRTSSDGSSKSGLIQRFGSGPVGAGLFGGYGYAGGGYAGGSTLMSMTATPLPRWPAGWGNVLIIWAAGIGIGALPGEDLPTLTTIPPEITDAVNKIAAWVRFSTPRGSPLDATALTQAAALQISAENPKDPLLGTVGATIRRFREFGV